MTILERLFAAITNRAINKTWIETLEPDGGAPWKELTEALEEAQKAIEAQSGPEPSPSPDSKLETYRKALELAEDALNTVATFAEDNGNGAVDKSDGQAWAAHARAVRDVCKALAGARP